METLCPQKTRMHVLYDPPYHRPASVGRDSFPAFAYPTSNVRQVGIPALPRIFEHATSKTLAGMETRLTAAHATTLTGCTLRDRRSNVHQFWRLEKNYIYSPYYIKINCAE